jgi:ATP/maltotriose-dependent transcriptional regulator MalT/predicted ATPase
LTDLLWTAPNVKLFVTSREALNLQEEWRYPVAGMPFPEKGEARVETGIYEAVQLFITCARRVRPDLALADEEDGVIRICQSVEGLPLALELAASWTKMLSCAEIADEIQRNVKFLATSLRNVPAHHRSMQAVFDQSWQLLSRDEQTVFKRLSVFRGGFDRGAAETVAGASLPVLSSLLDKSLLRRESDDRYQIHELLRQYAADQLTQSSDAVSAVYDLHCAYYAGFLQRRAEDITGAKQQEVIQEIAADLENIRAAWQWTIEHGRVSDIGNAVYTFYHFCDFQGRFLESTDTLEKAIASLDDTEPDQRASSILALMRVLLGWNYIRLGRFEDARVVFERSQAMYQQLAMELFRGFGTDPLGGLALLAHIQGHYTEAEQLAEQAREQNEAQGDKLNLQIALYVLGNAAYAQGDYTAAESYLQQAHALTKETHNRWMMAYVLSELGNVARASGHYGQAWQHYQAGFDLKEALNDPEGMAAALVQQGKVAWLQQSYSKAEQHYRRSLTIYQEIGDKGGLARALNGLGCAAVGLGDYPAARQNFQQALQIATEIRFVPLVLSLLTSIGDLLFASGRVELGLELLALATHHPASEHETKAQAQQILDRRQATVSPALFAGAMRRGQDSNLEKIVKTVQAELAASFATDEHPDRRKRDAMRREEKRIALTALAPQASVLVEPLTPRELEVLQLMAEGHTNQQIADELIISIGTVKGYTSEIYGKLGVSHRTQAVARARELKLLP